AHAADRTQLRRGPGAGNRHLPQGLVREHHVGGDSLPPGQLGPQGPEAAEQLRRIPLQLPGRRPAGRGGPVLPQRLHLERRFAVHHVLRPLRQPQHRILPRTQLQHALVQQEADALLDLLLGQLTQSAVGILPVHVVLPHPLRVRTAEGLRDDTHAEVLSGFGNAGHDGLGVPADIHLFEVMEAVVAGAASVRRVLAEVVQDILPQTPACPAVAGHLPQPLQVPLPQLLGRPGIQVLPGLAVGDEKLISPHILATVQQ
ncbi:Type IV secretory pathway, VirD4 component, TraG/TraD family ATPase, partial [Dysosmobacter welbionis]